jgi:hypothetical protein
MRLAFALVRPANVWDSEDAGFPDAFTVGER